MDELVEMLEAIGLRVVVWGEPRHCPHSGGPLHSCPYQREINDDDNPEYCDCCEECTQECADNI